MKGRGENFYLFFFNTLLRETNPTPREWFTNKKAPTQIEAYKFLTKVNLNFTLLTQTYKAKPQKQEARTNDALLIATLTKHKAPKIATFEEAKTDESVRGELIYLLPENSNADLHNTLKVSLYDNPENKSHFTKTRRIKTKYCPTREKKRRNILQFNQLRKEASQTTIALKVSQLGDKSGMIYRVHAKPTIKNLKKGGRVALARTNLTSYARRQIKSSGRMLNHLVRTNKYFMSPIMVTLTYGRNVPTDAEAKSHLNNFFTLMRKKKQMNLYTWVAQLQTGKRAKDKGEYSYRAEFGACIHFHILTTATDILLMRKAWCSIVNRWEARKNMPITKLGGVDVRKVFNASNYIAKYLQNEKETIKGNMWGQSGAMRKLITRTETKVNCTFDLKAYAKTRFEMNKRFATKTDYEQSKEHLDQINSFASNGEPLNVFIGKDYADYPIILTNDVSKVLADIKRISKNNLKVKNRYY
jgi:hypothetical protein